MLIIRPSSNTTDYLHHSFQRLNTSRMIYNNLPFKQLLKLTPFLSYASVYDIVTST